jgi:hypothetical protein
MKRHLLASWALLLLACTAAAAQVKLERKLIEGSSYTAETTLKVDQKLTLAGMETDTNNLTRTTSKVTLGKRDDAGMLRAVEQVESLQVNMSAMGTEYTFDSKAPDEKGTSPFEVLRDVHKGLAKRKTTLVYDKTNRVAAIEADQDLLASLPDQVRNLVKDQLDPEALKAAANDELDQIPRNPVKPNDSWEATSKSNFGAGQFMKFVTKYTYEGTIEKEGRKLERITGKVQSVSFGLENSPLPFTVKSSTLKASESKQEILFDRALGRIAEESAALRIEGDIEFDFNGQVVPSKLDLKLESTVVVRETAKT